MGSPPPELAKVKRALEEALKAPRRKVFVIGHAAIVRIRTTLVPSEPHPAHRRFVSFELDPAEPQRTDAGAGSNSANLPWCD